MAFSGLAALLSEHKSRHAKGSSSGLGSNSDDSDLAEESAGQELDGGQSPAFQSAAADCMDAMKSGDSSSFADSLAACIEMANR